MADKSLRLVVDSSSAKQGAREITQAMGKIVSSGKHATNAFQALQDVMNKQKGAFSKMGSLGNPFQALEKSIQTLSKSIQNMRLVASAEPLEIVKASSSKVVKDTTKSVEVLTEKQLRAIAVSKENIKLKDRQQAADVKLQGVMSGELALTVKKEQAVRNYVKTVKQELAVKSQQEASEDNMIKLRTRASNAMVENKNKLELLNNAEASHSILLNEQRKVLEKLEVSKARRTVAESDEYKQLIKNQQAIAAKNKELRATPTQPTATMKAYQQVLERTTKAEAMLTQVKNGSVGAMLRAEKAYKDQVNVIKQSLNVKSSEVRASEALIKARQKLENTAIAEQARTRALSEVAGLHSVKIQEQRRLTEELIRAKARLATANTKEYADLVRTRKALELRNRELREGSIAARRSVDGLSSSFMTLSTALAGATAGFSLLGLMRIADTYTNLTNKLKAVSQGMGNTTTATRELLKASIENRMSMEAQMEVASKMIRINETLGWSQKDLKILIDTVTRSVALSGATTQGAAGAIVQFGQAMSADFKTAGQELNSILEQTPDLAYRMAAGLRIILKDSTIVAGNLKRLAEDQRLNTRIVAEAIFTQNEAVAKTFGDTDRTIAQSMEAMRGSFVVLIGEMDKAAGVSKTLADGLEGIALSLGDFKEGILAATIAVSSGVLFLALGSLVALLLKISATVVILSLAIGGIAGKSTQMYRALTSHQRELGQLERTTRLLAEGAEDWIDKLSTMDSGQAAEQVENMRKELEDLQEEYRNLAESQELVNQGNWFTPSGLAMKATGLFLNKTYEQDLEKMEVLEEAIATYIGNIEQANQNALQVAIFNDADKPIVHMSNALKLLEEKYADVSSEEKDYIKTLTETQSAYEESIKFADQLESATDRELLKTKAATVAADKRRVALQILNKEMISLSELTTRLSNEDDPIAQIREGSRNLIKEAEDAKKKELRTLQSTAMYTGVALDSDEYVSSMKKIINSFNEYKALVQKKEDFEIFEIHRQKTEDVAAAMKALSSLQGIYNASTSNASPIYLEYINNLEATQKAYDDTKLVIAELMDEEEKRLANDKALTAFEQARQAALDKMEATTPRLEDYAKNLEAESNVYSQINQQYEARLETVRQIYEQEKLTQQLLIDEGGDGAEAAKKRLMDVENQYQRLQNTLEKNKANDVFTTWTDSLKEAGNAMMGFTDAMDESGKASAKLQVLLSALNVVTAVQAVLKQASEGDVYTALPRMATMLGAVASLGVSLGGLGGSLSSTYQANQEKQGTGTVLGDATAKSESISKAVEMSAKASEKLVGINTSMLRALQTMAGAISGASTLISRDANPANIQFSGMPNISKDPLRDISNMNILGGLGGKAYDTLDKLTFGITGAIGKMFGGKSKVTDQGIQILGGHINNLVNDTTVQAFQEVSSKKYRWSSTRRRTDLRGVSQSVENQFQLIFGAMVDTIGTAASSLGMNDSEINKSINSFRIGTTRISTKGMSSAQQEKALNDVFSSIFDRFTAHVFSWATEFQKAGEGLSETLTRVVTNMQVVKETISQLQLNALSGDFLTQIRASEYFIDAAGGFENLAAGLTSFIASFETEERKLEILQTSLTNALAEQNLTLPETREGYLELVKAQDINNKAGADNLVTLLRLTETADSYYSSLEDVNKQMGSVFNNIIDWVRALRGLDSTGFESMSMAQANYQQQLSLAASGDQDAISGITGYADRVLDAAGREVSTYAELAAIRAMLASQVSSLVDVPAFATGGYHSGGLRLVGENGPELEYTGSSQIINNKETRKMLSSSDSDKNDEKLVEELVNKMLPYLYQITKNTGKSAKYIERWDGDGLPEERDISIGALT